VDDDDICLSFCAHSSQSHSMAMSSVDAGLRVECSGHGEGGGLHSALTFSRSPKEAFLTVERRVCDREMRGSPARSP
jgi:hypothetical protein